MSKEKIELIVKEYLIIHDRCATHYKLWWNSFAGCYRFQACIGQEPYGCIFSISTDGVIS